MSDASSTNKPYVRLLKTSEIASVVTVNRKAFINDPLFNYFGSIKAPLSNDIDSTERRNLETFLKFLTKVSLRCGGRSTVVAAPNPDGSERICAATVWMPPHKRVTLMKLWAIFRSGAGGIEKAWGPKGIMRMAVEFPDTSHAAQKEAFKAKGIRKHPDSSWYLLLACTDPDEQGKGYLSMLVREGFAHAPGAIFTLEASTVNSRDRYAHLGFELHKSIKLGAGKCDESGYVAKGPDADGVTAYAMIKWK
ncbi:hypothetical protein OE88DRAFT_1736106 [Heliocybe sulcata]|uniref:N-acetyltransferase domain-containing protein n=1 Tax=Heliocybe sulcata TaxID=5364 RepID=A0A5C3N2E7_9AGAM|nr:hypothetical protein OE88DRAFT_1736106 [Heliocybe sulcata]